MAIGDGFVSMVCVAARSGLRGVILKATNLLKKENMGSFFLAVVLGLGVGCSALGRRFDSRFVT